MASEAMGMREGKKRAREDMGVREGLGVKEGRRAREGMGFNLSTCPRQI